MVATRFNEVNAYRVILEVKPEFLQNPDSVHSLYVKAGQTSVAGTALGGARRGPSARWVAVRWRRTPERDSRV